MIRDLKLQDMMFATIFLKKVCDELGRSFDLHSTVTSLLNGMGQHYIRVYEENGEILGMAGMVITRSFVNEKETRAIESLWHADPSLSSFKRAEIMVELRQDMEAFAKERGHDLYLCPNERGMSKNLGKHLVKHGYTLEESVYLAPKGDQ